MDGQRAASKMIARLTVRREQKTLRL